MKHLLHLKIALLLSVFFAACSPHGNRLSYDESELFYTQNIKKEIAEKLGEYLLQNDFFEDTPKSLQLDFVDKKYVLKMIADEKTRQDTQYAYLLQLFAFQLSTDIFDGQIIDIHLCHQPFESQVIVKGKKGLLLKNVIRIANSRIATDGSIDEENMRKIEAYLTKINFFENDEKFLYFTKTNHTIQLKMVNLQINLDAPIIYLDDLKKEISQIMKIETEIHFCNDFFETKSIYSSISK